MNEYFDNKNKKADNDSQESNAENLSYDNLSKTDIEKCQTCGSTMVFSPEKQALVCRHCGNINEFEKNADVRELALFSALQVSESWGKETTVYRCENCGAKVVMEKKAVSGDCAFCGTSHVVATDEIAGIKPNAIIPFLIDLQKASNFAQKWAKNKVFSPKKFKLRFSPENLNGVYSPNFTFDSSTQTSYNGRVGRRQTRVVGTGKNRRTETYIQWFNINGHMEKFFDDVTIAAGDKVKQKQFQKLSPFAKEKSCVYEKKFLHGFKASHYDKDLNSSWQQAKGVIDSQIRSDILSKHNASVVDYLNVSTSHNNVTYKYMLMPVYVGNYRFNKKIYNLYINGSTGKTYGKAPLSPLRVGFAAILLAAILAVAGYFFVRADSNESQSYTPLETVRIQCVI